jgi:hypothetical protein
MVDAQIGSLLALPILSPDRRPPQRSPEVARTPPTHHTTARLTQANILYSTSLRHAPTEVCSRITFLIVVKAEGEVSPAGPLQLPARADLLLQGPPPIRPAPRRRARLLWNSRCSRRKQDPQGLR